MGKMTRSLAGIALLAGLAWGMAPPALGQETQTPAPAQEAPAALPEAPPEAPAGAEALDAPAQAIPAEAAPAAATAPGVADVPEPAGVTEAVDALAERLVRTLPNRENWSVAVADFPDLQGRVSDLGRYLAQRASTRFSQREGFRAVDRLRLMQALEELKLESPALANPTVARRIGNQIGFNAIVVGTIADLGEAVEIDARVSDLDTQQVLPAVVVRVPKTPELLALVAGQKIAAKPGVEGAEGAVQGDGVMVLDASQPAPQTRNESYRVTVESARKAGRTVEVVVAFENLTGSILPLLFRKNAYLIDGKGDRWSQTGADSAGIWVFCCEAGIELIPGTRRRTRLEFRGPDPAPPTPGAGEEFSLVGKEVAPRKERTLVVAGVRLKAMGN